MVCCEASTMAADASMVGCYLATRMPWPPHTTLVRKRSNDEVYYSERIHLPDRHSTSALVGRRQAALRSSGAVLQGWDWLLAKKAAGKRRAGKSAVGSPAQGRGPFPLPGRVTTWPCQSVGQPVRRLVGRGLSRENAARVRTWQSRRSRGPEGGKKECAR